MFLIQAEGTSEQITLVVASLFKGTTIYKKRCAMILNCLTALSNNFEVAWG